MAFSLKFLKQRNKQLCNNSTFLSGRKDIYRAPNFKLQTNLIISILLCYSAFQSTSIKYLNLILIWELYLGFRRPLWSTIWPCFLTRVSGSGSSPCEDRNLSKRLWGLMWVENYACNYIFWAVPLVCWTYIKMGNDSNLIAVRWLPNALVYSVASVVLSCRGPSTEKDSLKKTEKRRKVE